MTLASRLRTPIASLAPLPACALALVALAGTGARAQERAALRLPALFADHMVLQRDTEAPIWGWGVPGHAVAVRGDWMEAAVETTADAQGRWQVEVPTPPAGGPHRLTIESDTRIELEDVWSGEVWVCSGQSNMEMPVGNVGPGYRGDEDAEAALANAQITDLRFFDVPNVLALSPSDDCGGRWSVCTPESAHSFSAVGFFYALALQKELDVPVGLIGSNWGGTRVQAWTSADTLRKHEQYAEQIDRLAWMHENREQLEAERRAQQTAWWSDLYGLGAWEAAQLDTTDWTVETLPGLWESASLGDFDGAVWYRRTFELPAAWADRELVLELGPIDDMDTTWLNGQLVGEHHGPGSWSTPRRYELAPGTARAGTNTLAVCVVDTGGKGGFSGSPAQLRIYPAGPDGEAAAVPLAGEWLQRPLKPMSELSAMPRSNVIDQHAPSSLFNGMIAPIVPFAIRGVIWYQGESNRREADAYRELFPEMIADWRAHWGRGRFPFYYVQIAPFNYGGDTGEAAELREAQLMALRVPNTGMAVTMDIGNPADIHPRNKHDVGRRLARWALARTYGVENVVVSGPLYRAMRIEDNEIVVSFDHSGGLVARDGPPSHLTIAGQDREFVPAEGRIEGEKLHVSSPHVPAPVAVRYAWGAADEPNLFNAEGLPASSFRTDDW